ncbi:DUF2148 domain-containing protein [Desulfofundulus thermocisternus]|uniref:DUF2148 domain-containing protein n=1 Tax=Desulfofundulus thermocisternus TaxID=42471 RepID=UPI0019FA2FF2|nr:DUF2148 domain-containing protein [Desulfofundulus thermocisternus]MBE3586008.1 hypothetical protein [Thermoanaerobacter sp.]MCS5695070.1 DUF2148 domain-containing protein [Desulfofundulus thermocisternus]
MAILELTKAEKEKILVDIARLAAAAGEGAQRICGGPSNIKSIILTGEDIANIRDAILPLCGDDGRLNMYMYGDWKGLDEVIKNDEPMAILVMGTDATRSHLGWNCGACGFATCGEFNKHAREVREGPTRGRGTAQGGPCCMWLLQDFGIAVVTAAAAVYEMGVPTRIHTSFGSMAVACGYLDGCTQALGISVGPWRLGTWDEWYNRPAMKGTFSLEDIYGDLWRCFPTHFAGFNGRGRPLTKTDPAWQAKGIYCAHVYDEEYENKRKAAGAKFAEVTAQIRQKVQERRQQGGK